MTWSKRKYEDDIVDFISKIFNPGLKSGPTELAEIMKRGSLLREIAFVIYCLSDKDERSVAIEFGIRPRRVKRWSLTDRWEKRRARFIQKLGESVLGANELGLIRKRARLIGSMMDTANRTADRLLRFVETREDMSLRELVAITRALTRLWPVINADVKKVNEQVMHSTTGALEKLFDKVSEIRDEMTEAGGDAFDGAIATPGASFVDPLGNEEDIVVEDLEESDAHEQESDEEIRIPSIPSEVLEEREEAL